MQRESHFVSGIGGTEKFPYSTDSGGLAGAACAVMPKGDRSRVNESAHLHSAVHSQVSDL